MIAAAGVSSFSGIAPTTFQVSALGSYCSKSSTRCELSRAWQFGNDSIALIVSTGKFQISTRWG
jgi:hypothetical protein